MQQLIHTRPPHARARAETTLEEWDVSGKRIFVLRQRGRFPDICHDHGLTLAREIEAGVFPEILATISHDVDARPDLAPGALDRLQGAFFNQLCRDVLRSCSDDFRRGVEALERGYLAGLPNPLFDRDAVEHACVAIDVGNISTGFLQIQNKRKRSTRYSRWRNYVTQARLSSKWGRSYAETAGTLAVDDPVIAAPVAPGRLAGMGCTGFWAAAHLAGQGKGLHARNFDAAFFDWNRAPVLSLIDETPANASYQRYAAVGTAGLVYPGGISGMNEAGLAASLHQMSTVNMTPGDGSGDFDLAPFVQQRILREARTLDEAVDIVRGRRHFAAWTILVSHAPSGKALRIELTGAEDERGDHVARVEASEAQERMVQTNHFFAPALAERHDFFADAHFTKSVGKWSETRARFSTTTERLDLAVATGELGTEAALDILADHSDAAIGGARRSFGRTVCRAYSLMSSIARASADRARPEDEIWFTVGDSDGGTPGPHTPLAGFAVDWPALGVRGIGPLTARTVSEDMRTAMKHYVRAFAAYERPRTSDGEHLRRKPTEAEMQAVRQTALDILDLAVASEDTGTIDPAFRYIRARLRHEAGVAAAPPARGSRARLLDGAAQDWQRLRELAAGASVPMTDWERALVHILSAATEAAREERAETSVEELLEVGRSHLDRVAREEFSGGAIHQDIKTWHKVAAAIEADRTGAELPDIDFVTVE